MTVFLASPSGDQQLPFGVFFPVFFIGLWLFISFVISRIGGWNSLASSYRAQQPFFGTILRFQAASFRFGTNYNGCLNFGANTEGLHLAPMVIFRAFHAPLFMPWSEVTARPVKMWGIFNFIELHFQRAPNVPVRIKPALAGKLTEASVGRFSVAASVPAGI